jgi:hypothetical protein
MYPYRTLQLFELPAENMRFSRAYPNPVTQGFKAFCMEAEAYDENYHKRNIGEYSNHDWPLRDYSKVLPKYLVAPAIPALRHTAQDVTLPTISVCTSMNLAPRFTQVLTELLTLWIISNRSKQSIT